TGISHQIEPVLCAVPSAVFCSVSGQPCQKHPSRHVAWLPPGFCLTEKSSRTTHRLAAYMLKQCEQSPQKLYRGRRTSANVQVNGYDVFNPSRNRIALSKYSASHRTGANRDHPFRVRRSIVGTL